MPRARGLATTRWPVRGTALAGGTCRILGALLLPTVLLAQVPGPNRSVVSGVVRPLDPTDPETVVKTDVLRQRQNEPVMAVSSTNPEHLLTAANDYRTIDIPNDMGTGETNEGPFARALARVVAFLSRLVGLEAEPRPAPAVAAEAWMGVYRSCDRGRTWIGSLLPGSPTDSSPASLASPLRGLEAASDPDLAPAPDGRAYLGGLAFNRGGDSAIFVARYTDRNDREGGACFAYELTRVVGTGTGKRFVDLPTVAADVTRPTIDGPKRYVYVAYTEFKEKKKKDKSRIFFSRSDDDGLTWSTPRPVSKRYKLNQGASLAVDPVDGTVYIVWREFIEDRILMVRSQDFGKSWSKPVSVHAGSLAAFDQPTGPDQFRTNGFPTIAIDGMGRIFVAWQEKVDALGFPDPSGSPRIVMTMSESINATDITWTPRRAVDMGPRTEEEIQRGLGDVVTRPSGAQVMPSLSASVGQLLLLYSEARDDTLAGVDVELDMRVAEIDPATGALFPGRPSVQVSEYAVQASTPPALVETVLGYPARHRPNLPMFRGGKVPFVGDYERLAPAQPFVRRADGSWKWASDPEDVIAPSFHAIWTDNRNVDFPDGDILGDWTQYGPPDTGALSCVNPGSRDQDVLTSEISGDLVAGTPSLHKPLQRPGGGAMPRAFVVYVENRTPAPRFVLLELVADGADTTASFDQFDPLLTSLPEDDDTLHGSVEILPWSTLTRTVYMESARPDATARFEVRDPDTTELLARVVLNETPYDYPLTNTAISDYEIHTPRISNPRISNPRISNDGVSSPRISNSTVTNPRISNPRISNEALSDSFLDARDLTFVMTNAGNTTTVYDLQTFIPEEIADDPGYELQLIVYRTVAAVGTEVDPLGGDCAAVEILHDEFISSIETPRISNPRISNPRISNEEVQSPRISNPRISNATFYLEPAEGPLAPPSEEPASVRAALASADEGALKTALVAKADASVAASASASATADTGDLSAPQAVPQVRWTLRIFQVGELAPTTPTLEEIAPVAPVQPAQPPLVSAAIVSQSTNVVAGQKQEDPPYVLFGTEPPSPEKEVDGELVPLTEPVNPPDSLAFAQGPVSTPVDETLPPVVVRLVDATGETAVVTGVPVTLALGSGPPATLSGATTRATENGLATFDDLSIDTVGSGYTLVASSPDLTGATSAPFEIVPSVADRLVFLTQPTDTAPSVTWPPIAVQIQDASGTPLPARTDLVTLTAAGGPGSLAGTTARNAVDGLATFDDLSIDVAGEGYTLQASAPGLVSDTSLPFDVVAPGEPLVLTVTSTADAGPGTLRQALLDANANVGHRDTIVFDVPAPYVISPTTALPVVTDPVVIDGATQPGYTGTPIVQIDGSGTVDAHGLSIIAGSSIVRGLAIHDFDLAGIYLSGGGGSTIQGNYLGTNPAGASGIGNTSGLETEDSSGNLVSANVLSGNAANGFLMTGGRGNRIESNLIGVHPAGTTALVNGNDGISTWPSSVGPVAIADTSIRGNVISGNGRYGIMLQAVSGPSGDVSAENTEILGNTIGLDVDGNALGNAWSGIGSQFASGLVIGRPSEGNVISGNIGLGISIAGEGSVPAIVQANRIGTDPTGMLSRGNGGGGISIVNSPGNRIGGSAPGEENVISNLDEFGIQIQNAIGNIIEGNLIGTNADGDTPVGPQLAGIWLTMASSDTVIRGNVISGHAESGVWVQSNTGVPIARTLVQANRIGTDPAGAVAVPNALDGVRLMGAFTTDSTIRDNVVSGNLRYGVLVLESTRTDILANRIGTNAAGTAALGNGWSGIEAHDADQTTIGRPGEGNVISANGRTGISIISSVGPNLVQANKIGTDVTGTVVIPNTEHGVRLSATGGDTIGGPSAGEGNIISGNGGDGIYLEGAAGEFIAGNWIGTNASGADLGNDGSGVLVSNATSSTNSIGGLGSGDGNTIAFNGGNGVQDFGGLTGNHILGNSIHSNALLGILDNGMLDAPVLSSANTSGGTTTVDGSETALGVPGATFQIELFWSTTCDASGAGEGEQFLGRAEVVTDLSGTADFSIPVAAISGGVVTATASAPAGTSAFSACLVPDISAVIGDIRTIISAEVAYQSAAFGQYGYLSCLATPSDCIVGYPPGGPWFLTTELASLATRVGYARGFSPGTEVPHAQLLVPGLASYAYTAAPVSGFGPGFCGDSTGVLVRFDDGLPTATDGQCVGGTTIP